MAAKNTAEKKKKEPAKKPETKVEEPAVQAEVEPAPAEETVESPANADETPAEEVAEQTPMEKLEGEIRTLIKEYNDSVEFAEFKRMKKLDKEMTEKVKEYTGMAEAACFAELKKADNVMLAAVKKMTFETLKIVDETNDDDSTTRTLVTAVKDIDPLRLHRKTDDGIGNDKNWWAMVERLNMLFTCEAATKLDLDPKTVRDNIAMSESAAKLTLTEDEADTDELLLKDIQSVVNAMLGEGYEVPTVALNYLRAVHQKSGREAMSVVCSTHKGMRQYMMNVCHAAVTGKSFILSYKVKKS